MIKFDNIIYKIKKLVSPYKMAIIAVVISVIASVGVSVVSSVGKNVIKKEMDAMGLGGLSAIAYSNAAENVTDINFYRDILQIKDIQSATPVLYDYATIKFPNKKVVKCMSWGISEDAEEIVSLNLINGRMINKTDIASNAFVCLIDESLAIETYKRNNICGKTLKITIGDRVCNFKIIGTVKKGSSVLNNMTGEVLPNFIYIPYSTMKNLSNKSNFDQIMFISDNPVKTQEDFNNNLKDINIKYGDYSVKLTNLTQYKDQVSKIVDTAFWALFLVSCVAVIICSISVGASVNTAVTVRQKDIGIKTSLGASRLNIMSEFLFSAIFSCFIGVLFATIVVILILMFLSFFIDISFLSIDYSLIILSIFATIILTAIFSLFPSYQAANLPPIKALNRE